MLMKRLKTDNENKNSEMKKEVNLKIEPGNKQNGSVQHCYCLL